MEILFKCDHHIYHLDNRGNLFSSVHSFKSLDMNIKHLDDVEVLYHYRDKVSGKLYPVYYECNGRFITKRGGGHYTWLNSQDHIKDNTLINLNLI